MCSTASCASIIESAHFSHSSIVLAAAAAARSWSDSSKSTCSLNTSRKTCPTAAKAHPPANCSRHRCRSQTCRTASNRRVSKHVVVHAPNSSHALHSSELSPLLRSQIVAVRQLTHVSSKHVLENTPQTEVTASSPVNCSRHCCRNQTVA